MVSLVAVTLSVVLDSFVVVWSTVVATVVPIVVGTTVVTVFQLVTGLPTQPMVVTLGGSLLAAGVLGEGSLVG